MLDSGVDIQGSEVAAYELCGVLSHFVLHACIPIRLC